MNELFRALCGWMAKPENPLPQFGWEGGPIYVWELKTGHLDSLKIGFSYDRGPFFTLDKKGQFYNGSIVKTEQLFSLLETLNHE